MTSSKSEVRDAEVRFAETMAKRDLSAFSSFVAEEAVVFSRRGILRGKPAVLGAWKAWFEAPQAPFIERAGYRTTPRPLIARNETGYHSSR